MGCYMSSKTGSKRCDIMGQRICVTLMRWDGGDGTVVGNGEKR